MGDQLNLMSILGIIFILSLLLTLWGMRDFRLPPEIKKRLRAKKTQGKIIFFNDKPRHYSSSSSTSSRE
jgi:hypothetical protein